MSLDQQHPQYAATLDEWILMRDSFKGQKRIKSKNSTYLPATEGMIADGFGTAKARGQLAYESYKLRANYPNFVKRAVELALGVMHHKPPTIKLPAAMEALRTTATTKGESLNQLLRRVNEEQLVAGRIGLLADIAVRAGESTDVIPYIATYDAETIINWDDGRREELSLQNLNLVVLDESEFERQSDFSWQREKKHRVLVLGDVLDNEGAAQATYRVGVFRENQAATFVEEDLITPNIRGNTLDEIPFAFINSKDIVPEPDEPPMLELAQLALTVYRGEADYRQSLFMQGQDTFVVVGTVIGRPDSDAAGSNDRRIGAGASLQLDQGGSASFVGVDSNGLPEQRAALENDRVEAVKMTGNLLDTKSRDRESGDALKIRRGAQTATLTTIALTGAAGVQKVLRSIAKWMGLNPEEVEVIPNLDFGAEVMTAREIMEFMMGKQLGAPLSLESLHQLMRQQGITDKEFEEEVQLIQNEEPLVDDTDTGEERGVGGSPAGGDSEDQT